MNKGHVIAFLAGAAVGVALSWRALKKKYERIAQKEINSVKEKFAKRYSKETSEPMTDEEACDLYSKYQEEIASYTSSATEDEEEGGVEYMPKPRVIAPEELGEIEEYDVVSLSLYSDGVLTDAITGEPIEDVENTVGRESLHHFGDYENDAIHVQNDRLKTYYEILMDDREFYHTPEDE